MKLIAGLGNPGPEYEQTRHNVGFMVIDQMATELQIPVSKEKFQAQYGIGHCDGSKIILVKPQSFMNRSGQVISKVRDYWDIELEDILVVHDDIDFSLGKMKFDYDAGAAGHRGVSDITEQLGTKAYYRFRLGVGRPDKGREVDFVLSRFTDEEARDLDQMVSRAATISRDWIVSGPEHARTRLSQEMAH